MKPKEDRFPNGQQPYVMSDGDKNALKENIVEATIHASELVRFVIQLFRAHLLMQCELEIHSLTGWLTYWEGLGVASKQILLLTHVQSVAVWTCYGPAAFAP